MKRCKGGCSSSFTPVRRSWKCRTFSHRPQPWREVHEEFPNLTLVLAHLGGYRMREDARTHLLGRGVYLDMSYCPDLNDQELAEIIRTHGANRVLFGTDFPWSHPAKDLERLCRLDLTQAEIEAVAWRNAARLLGLARP